MKPDRARPSRDRPVATTLPPNPRFRPGCSFSSIPAQDSLGAKSYIVGMTESRPRQPPVPRRPNRIKSMTFRWFCTVLIWGIAASSSLAQITSIPPVTDVPTYGTPGGGQAPPWRRRGGLFGRRASQPAVVAPATGLNCSTPPVTVVPGTTCSTPPVAVSPGTTYPAPTTTAPAAGTWQPVPASPATPATQPAPSTQPPPAAPPIAPPSLSTPPPGGGNFVPPTSGSVSAQRVIVYYAPPPVPASTTPAVRYLSPATAWTSR